MRILITGANGPAGLALGEQLKNSEHMVIGADMDNSHNDFYEMIETVPAASDPNMLDRLAQLIEQYQIDVLIPTVSDELPMVARAVDEQLAGCVVMIGGFAAVELAHDKWLTMQALARSGVSIPASALPSQFSSLEAACEELGQPLILKPRVARGGRGVQLLNADSDIDYATLDNSWLLQEFASGEEFAPMVFNGGEHGLLSVVVRKTELKQGLVGNAVDTVRVDSSEANDVAELALRAVQGLDLEYQADLDIRRRSDGVPVVLEINARFGANSRRAPELLDTVLNVANKLSTLAESR